MSLTAFFPLLGRAPDRSLDKVRELPGPGAYKLTESYDATLRNKNKVNFGASNRPGTSEIKRNIVPGPGTYDQTVEKIKQSGPQYKFGSSTRDKETSLLTGQAGKISPGPGTYA